MKVPTRVETTTVSNESKRDRQEATVGTPRPAVTGSPPDPDVFSTLDAQTASRALPGNKVELLFDGVSSFAARNHLIDGARESICLQTYIFSSDDTGWALAAKLAAKAQEGVQVRVIVDAMGCRATDPKVFDLMRRAGVDVRIHAPLYELASLNNRWHEKLLLIDGRVSIQGGMNIADEYALGGSDRLVFSITSAGLEPFRDVDLKLDGPSVAQAMKAFVRNWGELGGVLTEADTAKLFPSLGTQPNGVAVRVVHSNPKLADPRPHQHQVVPGGHQGREAVDHHRERLLSARL
jgi:cardiolipin synthase